MKLTILSWNIWYGKNLEQVINTLREIDADVVALQEVTERIVDGVPFNTGEKIAKALGYNYFFGKAFRTDRHVPEYENGNALLSKYEISESHIHMLSDLSVYEKNSATEPRNATEIVITPHDKSLHIFSTHLGYSNSFGESDLQITQAKKLVDLVPDQNTIVMGDFNSVPDSTVIKTLTQSLVTTDSSQSSWINMRKEDKPEYRIDYIFSSPDISVNSFKIGESKASDHLPLIAEIEI